MNICEQTKIRMLEGASLSAEEQKHLETCLDCRSLAAFTQRMEQLPPMEKEVPAYLDEAILKAASVPVSKPRWKFVVWKVALPAAAAFAFAAGVLFYAPVEEMKGSGKVVVRKQVQKKRTASVKKNVAAKETPVLTENFDEQVFSFALDVGSGMNTFSETLDSVSETMDHMI
ncbi:MAG: hypothetical protein IJW23_01395 [Lentisphaeria bacterium]|nr:hypothetical protein [Lentisphaeria bacterium]